MVGVADRSVARGRVRVWVVLDATEQLGREEPLREVCGVAKHVGALRAAGPEVNGEGSELLARAALAQNQDRVVALRQKREAVAQAPALRRFPDDAGRVWLTERGNEAAWVGQLDLATDAEQENPALEHDRVARLDGGGLDVVAVDEHLAVADGLDLDVDGLGLGGEMLARDAGPGENVVPGILRENLAGAHAPEAGELPDVGVPHPTEGALDVRLEDYGLADTVGLGGVGDDGEAQEGKLDRCVQRGRDAGVGGVVGHGGWAGIIGKGTAGNTRRT